MAPIEGKNNALDIEWRNYRNLHDHIGMLVESVSLMPEQVCAIVHHTCNLSFNYCMLHMNDKLWIYYSLVSNASLHSG